VKLFNRKSPSRPPRTHDYTRPNRCWGHDYSIREFKRGGKVVSYRVRDQIRGVASYVTYLRCDDRTCTRRINERARYARQIARASGWQVGPPKDYCPDHRQDKT
jgi:hypothetical protein